MANENQLMTLLQQEEPQIKAMLPQAIGADRWWALMIEVAKSRDLQRIAQQNPQSLIAAVKKIADWGLDLDGEEALIIPYGDEAVPQAMYKGLIRRAVEAGAIAHGVADIIKDGDGLEIISGTDGRRLIHRPKFNLKGGKRPIVGAYAVFTLPNGNTDFELMDSDDIEKVKAAALRMARRRKQDAGLSPAWREFEGEMAKKSVLRRGLKRFRGRRDSEAGRRFAEIIGGTRFDAETTGETLPPDNLPTGEDGQDVENGHGDGGPDARAGDPITPKVNANQPSQPPQDDLPVSDAEWWSLSSKLRGRGVTLTQQTEGLKALGLEDPAGLRRSQIPAFLKHLEATSDA